VTGLPTALWLRPWDVATKSSTTAITASSDRSWVSANAKARSQSQEEEMAELTNLEEKLAQVVGLAMAAQRGNLQPRLDTFWTPENALSTR
jgi:hypothetical protein